MQRIRFDKRGTLVRRARVFGMVAVSVGCLALSACGGKTNKSSAKLAVSESEVAGGRFVYSVPASVHGGVVNVQFTNKGKMPHEAQLLRLDPGHTIQQALATISGSTSPAWLHAAGGVGTVLPGAIGSAQVVLAPGTYYVIDGLSIGGGHNGPSNFTQGAVVSFQVRGSGSSSALATTPATITAQEITDKKSQFKIGGLKAGDNAITFDSPASNKNPHHFAVFELLPGKSAADAQKFLAAKTKTGPPPFASPQEQSASVIDPGVRTVTHLTLKPGSYAVVCFLSDRNGGPPHFTQGMIAAVTAK